MTTVNVTNGTLTDMEKQAYVKWATEHYGVEPVSLDLDLDGEFVNVKANLGKRPFERIRRITGYLVGTLDRFNNAKRAEVDDRVCHAASCAKQ